MGWIGAIIVGGLIGWIASIIMKTNAQQGIFLNIIVGAIGSSLGRFVFGLLGYPTVPLHIDPLNVISWVAALSGAIILLGIVNMVRRGSVR